MKLHPDEAEAQGYIIDRHTWVAYKGERFNPTEWHRCYTDLESELIRTKVEWLKTIRHFAKVVSPDYPNIDTIDFHELMWCLKSSFAGTEAANESWSAFARHLAEKLGMSPGDMIQEWDQVVKANESLADRSRFDELFEGE